MSIAFTLHAPDPCSCGKALPWHLFAIGDKRYGHICSCGRRWGWMTAKSATRDGRKGAK